ncbi:hypothetical protein ACJX0J_022336 [Zea mays]
MNRATDDMEMQKVTFIGALTQLASKGSVLHEIKKPFAQIWMQKVTFIGALTQLASKGSVLHEIKKPFAQIWMQKVTFIGALTQLASKGSVLHESCTKFLANETNFGRLEFRLFTTAH